MIGTDGQSHKSFQMPRAKQLLMKLMPWNVRSNTPNSKHFFFALVVSIANKIGGIIIGIPGGSSPSLDFADLILLIDLIN